MNKLLFLGLPGIVSIFLLANSNQTLNDLGKVGVGATGMSLISLSLGSNKKEFEIEKLKADLELSNNTLKKCQTTVTSKPKSFSPESDR
ncbi:MAG: hypothetical protein HWQ41_00490 [Nostoc sp. NOS(2021)]|uniref:hypothetical protein n=1 Tax=Nostoc sp. NOS(2021) TaxID=2815407 RepID=UPI0025EDB2EE|nr:hypothetical protein [Nostoc sp. NOS(2021)]MBN3893822.1 hypothetical protein [Nostoc sp. NOS(2021)]